MTDDSAHAARASARQTPITLQLGAEAFTFAPEIPLDIALALGTVGIVSDIEGQVWLEAHLQVDAECDTECADDGLPLLARDCPTELAYRRRLKKARDADGRKIAEQAFQRFHDEFLSAYKVAEGESGTSAGSPATAGVDSNATASERATTSTDSGGQVTVVSGD
jgi:hypothetical protein